MSLNIVKEPRSHPYFSESPIVCFVIPHFFSDAVPTVIRVGNTESVFAIPNIFYYIFATIVNALFLAVEKVRLSKVEKNYLLLNSKSLSLVISLKIFSTINITVGNSRNKHRGGVS